MNGRKLSPVYLKHSKSYNDMRLSAFYILEKHSVFYLNLMILKRFYAVGIIFPILERIKLKLKDADSSNGIQQLSV